MTNKLSKTLGTLVVGMGLIAGNFNSYSQEIIPVNMHLTDSSRNSLDIKIDLIMPFLMKYPPTPDGGISFDYDNQGRLIKENGFYLSKKTSKIEKIITIEYEYLNEKIKIKKIIYDNNGNKKMDAGEEIQEDNFAL